jgi:hypothetical protein
LNAKFEVGRQSQISVDANETTLSVKEINVTVPSNPESEIQAIKQRIATITAEMAQVYLQFVSVTAAFISVWYWEQTEYFVGQNVDVTMRLGQKKLSKLKAEVTSLQADISKATEKILGNEKLWWHLDPGYQSYYYSSSPPERLDYAVRLIAGQLAMVLEKYGYLEINLKKPGAWREWDSSRNNYARRAKHFYSDSLDWPADMKSLLEQYHSLHGEVPQLLWELEELKLKLEKDQAKNLWSQA